MAAVRYFRAGSNDVLQTHELSAVEFANKKVRATSLTKYQLLPSALNAIVSDNFLKMPSCRHVAMHKLNLNIKI